jgi:hypothetical protein
VVIVTTDSFTSSAISAKELKNSYAFDCANEVEANNKINVSFLIIFI